ncbi:AAA family ATPase [Aquipseudomonas alcaligenes]|uniref:AAA ATPase domain-containing protein n=1 Tax=Aquipseudomonas alcaligenes TaxID=43263 RepID=A0A1N6QWD5_AQUAC|nr:AAA family ATPase [Pseudomonas alcaligenes]SIQ20950.1 AAA ATPase domain-containing protein [Pseudomonas alcaligenes]
MREQGIKKIEVKGLHHHLDIELNFNSGLNIIYGKNGKGKTTVLHILANILELDINRFKHLQFKSIHLENFGKTKLDLTKSKDGKIQVYINGNEAGAHETDSVVPEISPAEKGTIREAFGGRPVYLPAFRAILERVKTSPYDAPSRDPAFDLVKRQELNAIREAEEFNHSRTWNNLEHIASANAKKTIQCREWFGAFVPTIRYPSISEVTDSISNEFYEAQAEVSHSERRMLSSMFVSVFRALVSNDETPSDGEIEPLMTRVRDCLDIEDDNYYPDHIGVQLASALYKVGEAGSREQSEAQKRVLKLYAEMLESRKRERTEAFHKVKKFEDAVNIFLDGKTLHVSDTWRSDHRRVRECVYIETENKKKYPLTSLSSGERQILTMLFSATRMSTTATGAFLIDEPELSLHVDWQRIILGILNSQTLNRQIIACTHSPEVGADHSDAVQMFSPTTSSHEPNLSDSEDPQYVMDDGL